MSWGRRRLGTASGTRGPLLAALAGLFLLGQAGVAEPAAAPGGGPPNIIFILCDDLGYGDLGVLYQNGVAGTKKLLTPELDQLASEGLVLDRHYCPAPVCAPSRSSLFSGLHQGHANVRDNQFDKALEDNFTLPSVLRDAGYWTGLIGKWGLQGGGSSPASWPAYPTNRGFDYFFGYVRHADGHNHYPAHDTPARPKKELYDGSAEISGDLTLCYTADLFTARAKKFIVDETTNHPERPFFLCLAYDTPHAALHRPTQAYPSGSGLSGGVQWLGTPGNMINTASGTIDSYVHPDYAGKGWSDGAERFATSVRRLDDCVGDLVQTLQDLSIDDQTLIVFTSDNGPHAEAYTPGVGYSPTEFDSFGPFDGIKRDTWEGGLREPTLVRWPGGIAAGQVSAQPSQFHDWMATFAELAGTTVPARSDGVSLLPTLTGVGQQREGIVYSEYSGGGNTPNYSEFDPSHRGRPRGQMQVIYVDGYKGIRTSIQNHDTPFEIFDVVADPQELVNLAGSTPYFTQLQARMKARVLEVRQPNSSASRPYDSALVPSVGLPLDPGLDFAAFEGVWPWVPEFRAMTPVASGTVSTLDLASLSRPTDAGLLFTGFVNVPADGVWTFKLSCDTGAHLRIHDVQVIDDDYHHSGAQVSGSVRLEAGCHPIRLYYRTGAATPSFSLKWSGPGVAEETIPDTAFFQSVQPPPNVITWTGASSQDIYEEANWDLSSSTISALDPDVPVDADMLVKDAPQSLWIPDMIGFGTLRIGDGHSLILDNSTLVGQGVEGLGGAQGTSLGADVELRSGASLELQFVIDRTRLRVGSQCTLTLKSGGQPLNNSSVDLTTGATLNFSNETVSAYLAEHLSKTTVDGAAAVVGTNLLVTSDGASGCVVTVIGSYVPFCPGDPGSGTPCPCGNDNDGSAPSSGCANGFYQSGAQLSATGSASLSADTLVLAASALAPSQSGLYFQADNDLSPGIPWGDGLRCAGGSLIRLGVRFSDATGSSDTSGFAQTISAKTGNIVPGETKFYQCWYRDPLFSACLTGFNLSNGLAVTWWP
jgi:arylsulfatase A-like enzyme